MEKQELEWIESAEKQKERELRKKTISIVLVILILALLVIPIIFIYYSADTWMVFKVFIAVVYNTTCIAFLFRRYRRLKNRVKLAGCVIVLLVTGLFLQIGMDNIKYKFITQYLSEKYGEKYWIVNNKNKIEIVDGGCVIFQEYTCKFVITDQHGKLHNAIYEGSIPLNGENIEELEFDLSRASD